MKTNIEIVTEIIEDLDLSFSTRKGAKITKEKLIECWSEYRKDPDYKFYGYADTSGTVKMYKSLFKNITSAKPNNEHWKDYILRLSNYKYCYSCKELHISYKFTINKTRVSGREPECISCNSIRRSKYYKNNIGIVNANTAKYRAAKLNRTPSWSSEDDQLKIKDLYTQAKSLEKLHGVKYHVDHIIPLQGELVSGLHILSNLQVITAEENLSKSNTYNTG